MSAPDAREAGEPVQIVAMHADRPGAQEAIGRAILTVGITAFDAACHAYYDAAFPRAVRNPAANQGGYENCDERGRLMVAHLVATVINSIATAIRSGDPTK